ncbi:MAG TPA: ROK family protein [Rudaea sp.]|nr:ROK family protein [Rudaea sp.]
MKTLVIDIGGSHVKCLATDRKKPVRFKSGPRLAPDEMVRKVLKIARDWRFHAVSIGYPGIVRRGRIVAEPHNLGAGWVDFNFQAAFQRPVKIINDAAMQALGAYQGGTMLFLGLGTGLGSALIVDGAIATMELGHLPYRDGRTYEEHLGDKARKRIGNRKWRSRVEQVLEDLSKALQPEYVVLGGGNVRHVKRLSPPIVRGGNADAFTGGFRLWERRRNTGRRREPVRRP